MVRKNSFQDYSMLSNVTLDYTTNTMLNTFFNDHKDKELCKLPDVLLASKSKITQKLLRHPLFLCKGHRSWEGLVVCFPGTIEKLKHSQLGTPFIRHILYPILDLYTRLREDENKAMPCIYLLGERFDDVFLRKIRFLKLLSPHVIILTGDLLKCKINHCKIPSVGKQNTENRVKHLLCKMSDKENLIIPINNNRSIDFRFICDELPTVEGTQKPERLDILGYDSADNSLVAFEIKNPLSKDRVDLENNFLQGLEHRNWLEENKMAIKFMFDKPRKININTRKRVKLVLGFGGTTPPKLFEELRRISKRDRYLEIVFCKIKYSKEKDTVSLEKFNDKSV